MNLLQETKDTLKENGKTIRDILWVGSENFYVDLIEFIEVADVEYDGSYGASEVAEDLIVVGKDWWLERHEYDGSEWWEFKTMPKKPDKKLKLKALTINQAENLGFEVSCGWEKLKKINGIQKGEIK